MAALQLPIVLTKLSYLIDNPWAVSLDRAVAAGLILADSLMDRSLGTRPITLVGYSLGSRVIFSCLQELAKRGAYGLVQNVYIFGSPIVVKKDEFLRAKTIVAGRFVNGYNRNDWILGYLFRLTNGGIRSVAGLAPIDSPWIENVDVTEEVPGHMQYRTAMPTLLMKCGWVVESEEFTEIEDPDPEKHEERQRELINEIEEARKELEREGKANARKTSGFGIFSRRKKAEKQEWEVYEDTGNKGGGAAGAGSGRTEDKNGNNHGILFDIDAIRAELAREGQDNDADVDMALQIKEIESTLPPMKLDIPPSETSTQPSPVTPTPTMLAAGSPIPFRGSKSAEVLPSAPLPASASHEEDGEIQMTFDTSFDTSFDHDSSYLSASAMGTAASASPADETGEDKRPGFGSSHTLPNMTLVDPWGDPDDEDFGKEKEISMTFA